MEEAHEPDIDGFDRELTRQQPGLVAFLRRRLGDHELARDAAQETLLKAWSARGRYDRRRPLGPWLLTIAARVAEDTRRRIGRAEERTARQAHATRDVQDPQDAAAHRETLARMDRALEELAGVAATVFRRFHRDGLPVNEIARQLDLPQNTVKSHLRRTRRRLAMELGEEET